MHVLKAKNEEHDIQESPSFLAQPKFFVKRLREVQSRHLEMQRTWIREQSQVSGIAQHIKAEAARELRVNSCKCRAPYPTTNQLVINQVS